MTNPTDASAAAPAGRRRWWRVGQNAGAAAVGRVVAGLSQLALAPLLLRDLGAEVFGWAMAVVALIAMGQFADLGVAMALQQELSETWARADAARARRIYASGARLLAGLGAGWLALALPAAWWWGPHFIATPAG
ncbi:MAG: hypothetical protein RLZZ15_3688, partial [Verrucomicrobiota bacterium]